MPTFIVELFGIRKKERGTRCGTRQDTQRGGAFSGAAMMSMMTMVRSIFFNIPPFVSSSRVSCLSVVVAVMVVVVATSTATTATTSPNPHDIVVGGGKDNDGGYGWMDGICYEPVNEARVGDTLTFEYDGRHDVYLFRSEDDWFSCDFGNATLLADVDDGPFVYTIREEDIVDATPAVVATITTTGGNTTFGREGGGDDAVKSLYFACGIGSHCSGGMQRLRVNIVATSDSNGTTTPASATATNSSSLSSTSPLPVSKYRLGLSREACRALQTGGQQVTDDGVNNNNDDDRTTSRSTCTEPLFNETDGRYYVSCLSGPLTMTPGGVINQAAIVHYPYPKDRRVIVGQRRWEFVEGDPINADGDGVIPVPVNQLYVHHLSGRVVLGQGSEGIRRSRPDAPFRRPYGVLTGDEGEFMLFHIIDLRTLDKYDEWLPCVECRCGNGDDNDNINTTTVATPRNTGGVLCCENCTSLEGPTVDYRMRYNVSYSDVEEDRPVVDVQMLTADISPAVGKNFEFDVPSYTDLLPGQRSDDDPTIQRLERVGPFNTLFHHEFFGKKYSGPDNITILRCVGHLHIAAIGMWLEDVETGETICKGIGTHGTDSRTDKGFLTSISVDDFGGDDHDDGGTTTLPPPPSVRSDQIVRLVTEYNATTFHTGVMGMFFLFVPGERAVTAGEASLVVDMCPIPPFCNASLLPQIPPEILDASAEEECRDDLAESPACRFGNMCDCDEFVNHPDSTGCGGIFSSNMGDVLVNDMCAKHCGCPPPTPRGGLLSDSEIGGGGGNETDAAAQQDEALQSRSSSCVDTLEKSFACRFFSLCDCETLVTAPESTGCGGVYAFSMGSLTINDVCPSYCDACPDLSDVTVQQELVLEMLEEEIAETCHYATDDCQSLLSNLYGCASGGVVGGDGGSEEEDHSPNPPGFDDLHPLMQHVVVTHGRKLARKHSRLGDASLHRGDTVADDDDTLMDCPASGGNTQLDVGGNDTPTPEDDVATAESASSSAMRRGFADRYCVTTVLVLFAAGACAGSLVTITIF